MRRLHSFRDNGILPPALCVLLATLCISAQLPTARAAITPTGDVDPLDPETWTSSTTGYIGKTANGTLTVDDYSDLLSQNGYIGFYFGSTGEVTVDGAGSTWTNSGDLDVGESGSGTLNITDGGAVSNSWGCIGHNSGSTGVVTVDGTGSMWTNSGLHVGSLGNGMLNITGGGAVSVSNSNSCIGNSFSTGVVTVDGAGSTWTNSSNLRVGCYDSGTLNITDGAAVSNTHGTIGYFSGLTTCVVTVDGTGSTWTNSSNLRVGYYGSGTLNITDGGAVTAGSVEINDQSLLAIDVGRSSLLNVGDGSGTITNNGLVRILAGAEAAAESVHAPIAAGTWSGGGVYQAVGGTWDAGSHQFTVSGVQEGESGETIALNLANTQRALVADSGVGMTGWTVGASFLHKTGDHTALDFTATAVSVDTLALLEDALDAGQVVKGAWGFVLAGDGYAADDPVYLSFDIGAGYSRNDLQVWYFDGSDWSEFDAMDLTCNGVYASFTATDFSGYAVAEVPEPGTLTLLLAAGLGLMAHARRKRK